MQIHDTIKRTLENQPDIRLCVLYGSAVTGRLHAESDIDIAVAAAHRLESSRLCDLGLALERDLNRRVEAVDLHTLHGLILSQVLTTGRIVLSRDSTLLARFMIEAMDYNQDMKPQVEVMLQYRAQRFVSTRK